eukprot:CCRYP_016321-RA/>CCRYP_016321-RA protein AED:0.44 eAED:0.44 QI:185/1/1/1/1/1/3/421/180
MAPANQDKNTVSDGNGLSRSSSSSSNGPAPPNSSEIVSIGITLIGSMIATRILATVSRLATAVAAPLAGLYLMTTCPSNDSFDAKRELKRVLRGENLPEDHPDKPKNFLQKTIAKVNATIQAETDAFVGCKVEIVDLMGLLKIASILSPTSNKYYYWLGAVNKWRYLMTRDVPVQESKRD